MSSSSIVRRPVLALLLLLVAPAALASRQYPAAGVRADFVRAMNEATQRVEETKHQQALMTRLLQAAKPTKTAFTSTTTTSAAAATTPSSKKDGGEHRDLENNNYNYQYGYYNYQYNYGDDDANNQEEEEEEEEADDTFADYGGLNLTQYALKYLGCQNIHTFSDDMAADGDVYGTLAMNRFVVFRLCPKDKCSNYNEFGCDYNYGEYTIPMDDYLTTMQYYHVQQYETYCQTCASCMTGNGNYNYDNGQENRNLENNNNYQNYYNNDGGGQYYNYGDDDNYNTNDDANGDDMAQNDDAAAANATDDDGVNCMYADVCAAYKDACGEEMFTDDNYMSYSANYAQYFECAEFDVGGSVSYLGPHCRSDGFTIGIGIYEDQYCSSYIGDMVDMEEVTGQAFDDEYLSPYYPKQCISCMASESYDLLTDDEMENEDENGGLYEVCGYLYDQAAKCNRHLGVDETFEGAYQQEANEEDVCNFVASLIENNYDEYGEAVLESPEWELSKWKEINAYRQDMVGTSPVQLLGLVFSAAMVVGLLLYTVYLRYKLTRRLPWSPGFGKQDEAEYAGRIGRASSGITMQRSMSNLEPGFSNSGSYA